MAIKCLEDILLLFMKSLMSEKRFGKHYRIQGGIYICSIKELLGYNTYKEEIADSKNDNKWYELNKFISLLVKANPNILEALFVDDNFIIGEVHPIMKYLREHRDMFLTKQCFISFYKYAESQIYKARGLNKKIVNPIKERKTQIRLDKISSLTKLFSVTR